MSSESAVAPAEKRTVFRRISGWLVCILLAFVFVNVGIMKLVGKPNMVQEFSRVGLGQWFRYFTGTLELVGAAGLLIPRFSRFAALLLAGIMLGAITAHLTVLRPLPPLPVVLLFLTLTAAWLRR